MAAAALERGFSQYYTLTTGDPYTSRVYRDGGGAYDVRNAGRYPATLDLERALYMSSNTYFLALEDALGSVEEPVRMAERMGMNFVSPPGDTIVAENHGAFTFGPYPTSPLDLASAYNTLAANGTQCDPSPVAEILDRDGQPLKNADGELVVLGPEQRCTPEAIRPGVASVLNQILRHDVEPGRSGATGTRAYVPGHQIAGKTGTSQENYSVAFVGYTPQYTASVMVLNPKRNQDVGGFGGGKGATIWHDAMAPILAGQPMVPFPPADPHGAGGQHQAGAVLRWGQRLRADPAGRRLPHHHRRGRQRPRGRVRRRHQPRRRFAGRCWSRRSRSRSATARTTWSPPPRPTPEPPPAPDPGGGQPGGGDGRRRATGTATAATAGAASRPRSGRRERAGGEEDGLFSPAGGGPLRPPVRRRPGRRRRPARRP